MSKKVVVDFLRGASVIRIMCRVVRVVGSAGRAVQVQDATASNRIILCASPPWSSSGFVDLALQNFENTPQKTLRFAG